MNPSQDRIQTRAYAKVNLVLSVGRAIEHSGLHPICSWMHAIGLYDEIEICRLGLDSDSEYTIGWSRDVGEDEPAEWATEDDLAVRAHKMIEGHVGHQLPVKICVSKSIPAGGGLGGGSSDAASVMIGLNKLFRLKISHKQLVELAMKLGSDIAFFIDPDQHHQDHQHYPRPAIVEGLGDQITRLEPIITGTPITLILPGFGCHTGKVYGMFDEQVDSQIESNHVLRAQDVRSAAAQRAINTHSLFNDLARPAVQTAPQLGEIRDNLQEEIGLPVHVSGSGSTLFVLGVSEPDFVRLACPDCSVVQSVLC